MKNKNIKLFCGDCLEIMKMIPSGTVDLILADLPYGITSNEWDSIIPLDKLWATYKRIIRENGVIALTGSQPFTSRLVMSNLEMFRHEWIWNKKIGSNFLNVKREPFKEHEQVLIFSRGGWIYNPQMEERKEGGKNGIGKINYGAKRSSRNYRSGIFQNVYIKQEKRYPSSIQEIFIKTAEKNIHPTQKPVALMEFMINTYSDEGGLILDNCMGSGTTGIACLNLGRRFIGIEKDKKYFKAAEKRIMNHRK